MKQHRRQPYTVSLPRDKSLWFDTWLERQHMRPSDAFEEMVDRLMEKDDGARRTNGTHKEAQAKRV